MIRLTEVLLANLSARHTQVSLNDTPVGLDFAPVSLFTVRLSIWLWVLLVSVTLFRFVVSAFSTCRRVARLDFRRPLVFGLSSPRSEGGARAHSPNSGW